MFMEAVSIVVQAENNQMSVNRWMNDELIHFMVYPKINTAAAAAAKLLQSCSTLCDPRDGSPPGSPVPGILQARTLERVAISFSNAWKWKVKVKSLSCVWLLVDPMDCSPPGSSIQGICQARVLEWDAIVFSENKHYSLIKKERS